MTDKTPPPTGVAYSYIRMSTDQQIKGDSLRRQLELSRRWAEQHGLTLDESLRDIGVSAYRGKNRRDGSLGKFLNMIEMGRIRPGSYLLVESLDRLSRDQVLEALSLFLEIIRSGVTIVTLADDQTYSQETVGNDWSKLIISLTIMARAHEESLRKSERVSQSYAARRALAVEHGYNMSSVTPGWIDAKRVGRGKIEFTFNDHAPTVRRIFEWAADGLSQYTITRMLNGEKTPRFRDTNEYGWTQSFVGQILNGRQAIGEFQPHKHDDSGKRVPTGDAIPNYYPAVVSEELWLRARNQKKPRKVGGRKGLGFGNLFTGMCRCANCGGTVTYHSKIHKGASKSYLNCNNRRRGVGCSGTGHGFRYERLEAGILDNVREFMLSDIMRVRREQSPLHVMEQEIASLKTKLEDITRREASLLNQLEDAGDLAPMILTRLRDRRAERAAAEERLQVCERSKSDAEFALSGEVNESAIEDMRQQWENSPDIDERHRLRAKAHVALRTFIDFISFNTTDKTATVIVLGGLRAYKFLDGQLIDKFDLTGQLGSRTVGKIPASVFVADGRTSDVVPERAQALSKLQKAKPSA